LFEGEDFSETLTRAKFEELNMDLFRSTMVPVKKVLEDADMKKGGAASFHRQLIVGGLASEYENEIRAWLEELE
jgi:molecular chaperone DnaK (HSP70)